MGDRRGGYASGRARREQILDAAIAAFGRDGFHSATIKDLAAACGISRSGLLHHFADKEDVLAAVLARRDEIDRAAVAEADTGDASRILQAIVNIVANDAATPGLARLYTVLSAEATNPDHPAHTYFTDLYDRLRTDLTAALARAQVNGSLAADLDVETIATNLIALKDGLALQVQLSPGCIDPARELAAAIHQLTGVRVAAPAVPERS